MHKILLAASMAAALFVGGVSSAFALDWVAVAMNDRGHGAAYGDTEEDARSAAIDVCEDKTAFDCSEMTKSVPVTWYLVGIQCRLGPSAVGSRHDTEAAIIQALENLPGMTKAEARRCELTFSYEPDDDDVGGGLSDYLD